MGIDVAFFSAPSDAAAAEAERRPGRPLGWPVRVGTRKAGSFRKEAVFDEAGAAFDGFAARGYDGVVNMGKARGAANRRPVRPPGEGSAMGR